jgi:hypothetical protein
MGPIIDTRRGRWRRASESLSIGDYVPILKRKKNQPSASDSDLDEAKILKLDEPFTPEEGKILKLKDFVMAYQVSVARIPFFKVPMPEDGRRRRCCCS